MAEQNAARNARRARSAIRRYCCANRLRRHAVLTYAEATFDLAQVRRDLLELFRKLNQLQGAGAAVAVAEPHPEGHGWHIHVALPRYLHRGTLAALWGHGHVSISLHRAADDTPAQLSGYLAKYLAKTLDEDDLPEGFTADQLRQSGSHRYWLQPGWQPLLLRYYHRSYGSAWVTLRAVFGGAKAAAAVLSTQVQGYCGPTWYWFAWAEAAWHAPPRPATT